MDPATKQRVLEKLFSPTLSEMDPATQRFWEKRLSPAKMDLPSAPRANSSPTPTESTLCHLGKRNGCNDEDVAETSASKRRKTTAEEPTGKIVFDFVMNSTDAQQRRCRVALEGGAGPIGEKARAVYEDVVDNPKPETGHEARVEFVLNNPQSKMPRERVTP
eukprot:TRINITY_DN21741_c0_g1_i1.p1 TRINITY_DN21741_c0_g1~~TRINITY_DN21741_c0_g1_i1.p1  ORF type:complete len:162 (+),score=3.40 TRINITY_DN21741_c0_g1_i1:288-773(+)